MLDIEQLTPDFSLPDLDGQRHRLSDYRGQITVLNFWSAECPWCERTDRELVPALGRWGQAVKLLPIASNFNESPELLARVAAERALPLVLSDADGVIANLYGAEATPHVFVLDQAGLLCYQGAVNDVTFRQREVTHFYVEEAVEALLADRRPGVTLTPAYGCALVRF
jgi:peroxiredoxin